MLLTQLRRIGRDSAGGFAAVEGPADAAAFAPAPPAPVDAEAEVVEEDDGVLRARAVGHPAGSAFTSFLDGIQRSAVTLYHGPVPIVYAYGAAVVRTRRGRRLSTLAGAADEAPYLAEEEAVFLPDRLVEREAIVAAGVAPERVRDTSPPDGEPLPLFPPALYARAAEAVNRWRESLEASLARRWCRAGDDPGWLLVDGSLTADPELAAHPRAVGVVKSHRTRFFDGEDARVLLGLGAGERTSVFRPGTRRFTPVHSWYLRLRPAAGRDVFWGLVRVEVAVGDDPGARADEISRWLLAERAPISLPDARWDRLLYPIRDCEAFLRARAPNL